MQDSNGDANIVITILPTKSVYQQNFPSQSGNKPFGSAPGKLIIQRENP
jgi:hypothetical protein